MADVNVWQQILMHLQTTIAPEDFRRWFSATAYAADSGDQVTVWVPSEGIRRHLELHYQEHLRNGLKSADREGSSVRFVVAGFADDEDDPE